jgi:hypothetical protein
MQTNPTHFSFASRLGGATATISLAAALVLTSGRAQAQNYPVATVVPGHVYGVRGFSIRNGDYLVLEPSFLFVFGPVRPPLTVVARAMLGIGGSGAGIGLAMNLMPSSPGVEPRTSEADYFMGPFVSLEAHIERMYGPTSWRGATYAGPQLSLSLFVLKASLGWMVDLGDRTDHHVQIGLGGGF